MKQYNIYKTTNLVNGKFYWGVHNSIDENDGYFGGGTVFRKAIKKYGKDSFRRTTMVTYESAADAYFDEGLLVTQKYIDENPMCYNVRPGGKGGNGHKKSAETRAKIHASLMGHCRSLESRQKQSITSSDGRMKGKNSPNFGKAPWNKGIKTCSLSDRTKRKISETAMKNGKNKGQNHPNYGKSVSKEVRKKLSESKKKLYSNKENHPNYGKTWILENNKRVWKEAST